MNVSVWELMMISFTCSEDDIQKELETLSIENQGAKSKEAEKVFFININW